jgi:hypothetical protein
MDVDFRVRTVVLATTEAEVHDILLPIWIEPLAKRE